MQPAGALVALDRERLIGILFHSGVFLRGWLLPRTSDSQILGAPSHQHHPEAFRTLIQSVGLWAVS